MAPAALEVVPPHILPHVVAELELLAEVEVMLHAEVLVVGSSQKAQLCRPRHKTVLTEAPVPVRFAAPLAETPCSGVTRRSP